MFPNLIPGLEEWQVLGYVVVFGVGVLVGLVIAGFMVGRTLDRELPRR